MNTTRNTNVRFGLTRALCIMAVALTHPRPTHTHAADPNKPSAVSHPLKISATTVEERKLSFKKLMMNLGFRPDQIKTYEPSGINNPLLIGSDHYRLTFVNTTAQPLSLYSLNWYGSAVKGTEPPANALFVKSSAIPNDKRKLAHTPSVVGVIIPTEPPSSEELKTNNGRPIITLEPAGKIDTLVNPFGGLSGDDLKIPSTYAVSVRVSHVESLSGIRHDATLEPISITVTQAQVDQALHILAIARGDKPPGKP